MKLSALILDPSAQPRVKLDDEVIQEYTEAMREGRKFPPLTAYGTNKRAWLADGWHRYHAAQQADHAEVDVDVRPGNLDDAVWHSVTTNAEHGLRRSNADKNRAVTTALTLRPTLTDNEIARHCSVHHSMVSRVRKSLEKSGAIEPAPIRDTSRVGEPIQQRVRAPSGPKNPPVVSQPDPDENTPDEPLTSPDEPIAEAPSVYTMEGKRIGTVIAPEESIEQSPKNLTMTPDTSQPPVDEATAVAVIKRYRRLKLFNPIRAAKLLGDPAQEDRMTADEMEQIGGWFINVAEEMTVRGMD